MEPTTYPNAADDSEPVADTAIPPEIESKNKELHEYSHSMLDAYLSMNSHGEAMWMDYLTDFLPYSIESWGSSLLTQKTELL